MKCPELSFEFCILSFILFSGPDGKDIHSGERETNGKYTFAAHLDGLYKYCFSNKVSERSFPLALSKIA